MSLNWTTNADTCPVCIRQLIGCLDVQMSSLPLNISIQRLRSEASYKKLCDELRPPHVRSESQTVFESFQQQ